MEQSQTIGDNISTYLYGTNCCDPTKSRVVPVVITGPSSKVVVETVELAINL